MSKETFLEELRGYLEILEDQEQQDILEEYAQHIDIKVQNGQSEEDAIRDFGPVRELASEILEAYHVKPEFGESRGRRKAGLPGIGSVSLKEGERKLRGLGNGIRKSLAAFWGGLGRACRSIGRTVKRFFRWFAGLFRKRKETEEDGKADVAGQPEAERRKQAAAKRTAPSGFFRRLLYGIGGVIRWCLRLCWNLFWLFVALCMGCFALAALFGFGMLLILALQGYPLGGALLVCLGCFLAGGSAAGICLSLLRRKERQRSRAAMHEAEAAEESAEAEERAAAEENAETEQYAAAEEHAEAEEHVEPEKDWQEVRK